MYRKYLLASKTPNGAVIRIWKEGEPDGESISLRNPLRSQGQNYSHPDVRKRYFNLLAW